MPIDIGGSSREASRIVCTSLRRPRKLVGARLCDPRQPWSGGPLEAEVAPLPGPPPEPETRVPNSESRKKSEFRNPMAHIADGPQPSAFELRISFGFRASEFGFQVQGFNARKLIRQTLSPLLRRREREKSGGSVRYEPSRRALHFFFDSRLLACLNVRRRYAPLCRHRVAAGSGPVPFPCPHSRARRRRASHHRLRRRR